MLSFNLMKSSTADYYISLSNKLSEQNDVVIVASKVRETSISLCPDIRIVKWPSKRPSKWKDFMFLFKLVRSEKPDVMISIFGTVNLFLIVGWLLGVANRIAWIRSLSTQFPQNRFKVFRRSLVYRLGTQIIANSEATKEDAAQFFNIAPTKITVLPNSVANKKESFGSISINSKKLVYVGRLHPTKGVDVLLEAIALLKKRGFSMQLDIIGSGHLLKTLERQSRHLKIQDAVFFRGEQPKEQVLMSFKEAYCAIVPSYSEAFGFTVIEAMSVATCVIGADNTGIKEIILPNETGLLFETGNAMDLANKIASILKDDTLRNGLALGGYQRFLERYEHSKAIQRDVQFFKALVCEN